MEEHGPPRRLPFELAQQGALAGAGLGSDDDDLAATVPRTRQRGVQVGQRLVALEEVNHVTGCHAKGSHTISHTPSRAATDLPPPMLRLRPAVSRARRLEDDCVEIATYHGFDD